MCGTIRAGQSGHHDIHHSLAGTWGWCAGGPSGHRGWRRSGAGHGLFLAFGPAPGARNFAFYIVAAHRTRSLARILEAGSGGLACRDLVRSGISSTRAQGTSLVALIPPTGVLALMAYAKEGFVSWRTGLLLIPGVFLGGIAGGILAKKINPRKMRQVFAGILVLLGVWQMLDAWWR